MNYILDFTYNKHKFKDYMDIVEHSRTIQSVVKKLEKLKYKVN